MDAAKTSESSNTTVVSESNPQLEGGSSKLLDENSRQDENVTKDVVESTHDEDHAKPFQSAHLVVNSYSDESEILKISSDVDDKSLLNEGLKLNCMIASEASQTFPKARLFVRKDLFPSEAAANSTAVSEDLEVKPVNETHRQIDLSKGFDFSKDSNEPISSVLASSPALSISEETVASTDFAESLPQAKPLAIQNHSTVYGGVNRQQMEHVRVINRFTNQRQFYGQNNFYGDVNNQQMQHIHVNNQFNNQRPFYGQNHFYGGFFNHQQMQHIHINNQFTNRHPFYGQNNFYANVNRQPMDQQIRVNNRFTNKRKYKHTYYDSDGNEVAYQTYSEPLRTKQKKRKSKRTRQSGWANGAGRHAKTSKKKKFAPKKEHSESKDDLKILLAGSSYPIKTE